MDNILSDNINLFDDFNPASIAIRIARQFRERRLELNLPRELLAKQSGVSAGSIKRFETTGEISLKSLLQLALVIGYTDEFLQLFARKQYASIEEVVAARKVKTRKRARRNA